MKLKIPAVMPIKRPKLSPINDSPMPYQAPRKRHTSDWPRKNPAKAAVDLARERPRRLAVTERHQPIDRRNHLVPIEKHVEDDDRRHDKQRNQADQRRAAVKSDFKKKPPIAPPAERNRWWRLPVRRRLCCRGRTFHQNAAIVSRKTRDLGRNQCLQLDRISRQRISETYG